MGTDCHRSVSGILPPLDVLIIGETGDGGLSGILGVEGEISGSDFRLLDVSVMTIGEGGDLCGERW